MNIQDYKFYLIIEVLRKRELMSKGSKGKGRQIVDEENQEENEETASQEIKLV